MKTIKITPDWILTELPHKRIEIVNGKICILKVSSMDACWFNLALTTLNIEFKQTKTLDEDRYVYEIFEIRIEDVRDNCPSLYVRLNEIAEYTLDQENRFRSKYLPNNDLHKRLKEMKKNIQITPEWVLNAIPHLHLVDGDGKVRIHTNIEFDGCWIKLALTSLNIEFTELDWVKNESSFFARFEFRIADIREECPTLYEKLNSMDLIIRDRKDISINCEFIPDNETSN